RRRPGRRRGEARGGALSLVAAKTATGPGPGVVRRDVWVSATVRLFTAPVPRPGTALPIHLEARHGARLAGRPPPSRRRGAGLGPTNVGEIQLFHAGPQSPQLCRGRHRPPGNGDPVNRGPE